MEEKIKTPLKVKAHQLELGDVVIVHEGMPFGTATVKQIRLNTVLLFRPFVQTSDFSYTGGVICYIGIEEYEIDRTMEVTLLERKYIR